MAIRDEKDPRSWRQRLRRAVNKTVDFVLPPVCVSCRQIGAVFCQDCRQSLVWLSGPICARCGRSLPRAGAHCAGCHLEQTPLQEVRAVCAFEGAARDAVHALKYNGMFSVAVPLAELMAQRYPQWSARVDLILPVPLHPERVRERGYNQAALLVRHLCRSLNVAYGVDAEGALWRTRHTRPQVGLDRVQRRQNVEGAFAADRTYVHGKNVLLIDDVCTSGATMAAAANALLNEGASTVRGYCFARPVSS